MGIPFLPQIPIRNPWEFMIAQALEDIPGLQAEKDATATLDLNIWASRAKTFGTRLNEAFKKNENDLPTFAHAFEGFEPSAAVSSSWQAFIWELSEQNISVAKIQIAGPITAQWSLRLLQGGPIKKEIDLDLTSQIYRFILARSLAMIRRLQQNGIQPILYIDEPALYGLSIESPRHILALQELKFLIHSLKKAGAQVGLHCCSNANWEALIGPEKLELNTLSIDTELSLKSLLSAPNQVLETFIRSGGNLSLGIIPTARPSALHSLRVEDIFKQLLDTFHHAWGNQPELIKKVLKEAIYTPACGLALHSISDAELILEILNEYYNYSTSVLTKRNPA